MNGSATPEHYDEANDGNAGPKLTRPGSKIVVVPETIPEIHLPQRGGFSMSLWKGQMSSPGRWTMVEILQLVAEAYSISTAELRGHGRTKYVSRPRQHAMWLMARQPHLSLPQIGRFLGERDHTTILHGVRAHAARIAAEWPGSEAA